MDAAYRQEAARREAEFAYGDIAQVLETLASGPPANVADLAALTLENPREKRAPDRRVQRKYRLPRRSRGKRASLFQTRPGSALLKC